jgi:hypothetical protein
MDVEGFPTTLLPLLQGLMYEWPLRNGSLPLTQRHRPSMTWGYSWRRIEYVHWTIKLGFREVRRGGQTGGLSHICF